LQWLAAGGVSPDALEQLLTDLAKARPSMVPLANAIERVRQGLVGGQRGASAAEQALPVVDSVLEQIASANRRVCGIRHDTCFRAGHNFHSQSQFPGAGAVPSTGAAGPQLLG